MDRLYDCFIEMFLQELSNLEIGYSFNKGTICKLRMIISEIFYIENTNLSKKEIADIIETII